MTPQEVIELIEKEKEIIREKMEHNKKLFETGETNIDLYNKGLMREMTKSTHCIDDSLSIEQTIKMLSEFLEEIKAHENKPDFQSFIEDDYDDDDKPNSVYGCANWYELTDPSDESIEKIAKEKVKTVIADKLCPPDTYRRYIDCKLLSLFMDGTIDWEALQKLVHSDCNI